MQVSRALPGVSNSFWDAATTNGCANLGVVDLDLAQVRAFVAVVDHGHFGRAAQTLAVSQQEDVPLVVELRDGGPGVTVRR